MSITSLNGKSSTIAAQKEAREHEWCEVEARQVWASVFSHTPKSL